MDSGTNCITDVPCGFLQVLPVNDWIALQIRLPSFLPHVHALIINEVKMTLIGAPDNVFK
jgi:hypothetical protein